LIHFYKRYFINHREMPLELEAAPLL